MVVFVDFSAFAWSFSRKSFCWFFLLTCLFLVSHQNEWSFCWFFLPTIILVVFFSPEPVIIFVDHFAGFFSHQSRWSFSPIILLDFPQWFGFRWVYEALRKHVRGTVENSKAEFGANNADSRHVFGIQLLLMVSLAITMGSGTGGATTKGKGFWRRPSLPAKSSSQSRRL